MEHWDSAYTALGEQGVSWYQAQPRLSAELIADAARVLAAGKESAIIDAGGGASLLATWLADAGYTDVTVLDVSEAALAAGRRHPGSDRIAWIHADLLTWRPGRAYQIWHDRAVFHFLTDAADRASYLATLRAALYLGGAIIMATFAADGPRTCSGLPVARYDADGLAAELTAAFGDAVTITGSLAEIHRTPGGVDQPFTWITARLGVTP